MIHVVLIIHCIVNYVWLFLKAMGVLTDKILWKSLYLRKSQLYISSVFCYIARAKDEIPNAQSETEVYTMLVPFRDVVCVVPDVHLWIIEDIFQVSKRQLDIAMIEMTNGQSENVYDEKISQSDSDQCQGDVFNGAVHNVFHPMIAQMCRKAHLLHGVMHLMKLP